jgi:two-component system sensor histidine kinase HydH
MWNLTVQSALIAVIVAATTTAALLLRSRRPLHISYAGFALSVGFYYICSLLAVFFPKFPYNSNFGVFASGICLIFASSFFDELMGEAGISAQNRRRKTYLVGCFIMLIGVTPLASMAPVKYAVFAAIMFLFLMRVRIVLNRAREVTSKAEQTRLRYLALSGALALLLFCTDFGQFYNLPIPAFGGVVIAIYLYFIFQALLASRLLDLHELLGKALVFATLTVILAMVYGLFVGRGQTPAGLFFSNILVASSVVLILFDPLRQYLEEKTVRMFFKEHITFARDLRSACRILAGFVELKPAVEFVLDQIYDNKRATHAAIYLLDFEGTGFVLQGHRGPTPVQFLDGRRHPVLFRHIVDNQEPIIGDALKKRANQGSSAFSKSLRKIAKEPQSDPEDLALLEGLDELNCELLVPLCNAGQCVGLLSLNDKRLSEAYSNDEIIALRELSNQLSITVQNSHLFSVLKERDRLAALGEMSAGLAHEIKNPLTAIKGAAQTLDPQSLTGEDRELLQIIVDEVNRLNKVVSEFLDYSRPYRGTFSPLSLNELVQKTVRLLDHDTTEGIETVLDLESGLPEISGDSERLRQVLINLILNARDAMESKGTIRISTRSVSRGFSTQLLAAGRKRTHVELRVHDTGPGISAKARDKLFIPFFTTKEKGTGLGLAMCQRIVRDHGGIIDLRSLIGKGSTFIVRLPTSTTFFMEKHYDA